MELRVVRRALQPDALPPQYALVPQTRLSCLSPWKDLPVFDEKTGEPCPESTPILAEYTICPAHQAR